ncbi:hypothetical protein F5X99DRAFT_395054 [Biscogniauxia marginata]|nr:hypothetical protein F5X99DRAFT_395054 [Biscogniauxia marginata]
MANRPRYTHAQLEQYFDRICLPEDRRHYSVAPLTHDDQLRYLAALVKHQLVKVPFENLTQHYSWHRVVDVKPQHLFKKIVAAGPGHGRGRGGYCMEANTLFHTVLLSLGFHVFMAGARVHGAGANRYGGFSHCVNIVGVAGRRYVLDVGFGANGPAGPLPLEEGREHAHAGPAARVRLVREAIPQQVDQGFKVWIYQLRIGPDAAWTPMYCFVDFEFLLEDIRCMNLSPWKSETSFFARKVLVTRFTTNREADGGPGPGSPGEESIKEGRIDGAIILWENSLKWRRDGETKLEIKLENENQRIDALRRYFGIELDEEDREAIKGTVSEIVGDRGSVVG